MRETSGYAALTRPTGLRGWFFVFGFEKNVRVNISNNELEALQSIAADLIKLKSPQLDVAVHQEKLLEICNEH